MPEITVTIPAAVKLRRILSGFEDSGERLAQQE